MKFRKLMAILISVCFIVSGFGVTALADSLPADENYGTDEYALDITAQTMAEPDAATETSTLPGQDSGEAAGINETAEANEALLSSVTETVSYLYPVYKVADDPVSGVQRWMTGTESCIVIESSNSSISLYSGWYAVSGDVYVSGTVTCSGDVNLILEDGCSLEVNGIQYRPGFLVTGEGNSLTIYAQSTDDSTIGELTVTGGWKAAGIGGGAAGTTSTGNNITINGGNVTANGEFNGAGIGGGLSGIGSNIVINGGNVVATGGSSGAGIGGGYCKEGNNIIINGGSVTATGGDGAAGIGGGNAADGNDITINGGTVTATAGATGIGGGYGGNCENININGGTVTAAGGERGAGIGGGGVSSAFKVGEGYARNITITGGTVIARGGLYGAGIGGGSQEEGSNITITGGTIEATGGLYGAGIGGGYCEVGRDITITGGTITAAGGYESIRGSGDGIGDGCLTSDNGEARRIFIDEDVVVKAGKYENPEDVVEHSSETDLSEETTFNSMRYVTCVTTPNIKYLAPTYKNANNPAEGINGVETKKCRDFEILSDSSEMVTLGSSNKTTWYVVNGSVSLEEGAVIDGDVCIILADNCILAAGHGSNQNNVGITVIDGASLTIYAQSAGDNMGSMEVIGGYGGAGIGGNRNVAGTNGSGSNITINGGNVTAIGGYNGAGIGGGDDGDGSNIIINGGAVTARGLGGGAGIGGGRSGNGSNIVLNGGTISASAGMSGAEGIGSGSGGTASDSITAGTQQMINAGSTPNPATVVMHEATADLSEIEDFRQQYVTITSNAPGNPNSDQTAPREKGSEESSQNEESKESEQAENNIPETGDDSGMMLWVMLLILALGAWLLARRLLGNK